MNADTNDLRQCSFVRADFAAFEDLKRRKAELRPPDHQRAIRWFDDAVWSARSVGAMPSMTDPEELEIKCRYAAALNRIGTDRGAGLGV